MKLVLAINGALTFILLTSSAAHYMVGCYYTTWSQYRTGNARFQLENIDFSLCTHVIYFHAAVGRSSIIWAEPYADNARVVALRNKRNEFNSHNATNKVDLILGVQSYSGTFSSIGRDNSSRQTFAQSAVQFLRTYSFDGLELDWSDSTTADKQSFTRLCKELQLAFANEIILTGNRRLLLGTLVTPVQEQIEQSYEVSLLSSIVDWITVKAYNMLPDSANPRNTRLHSALFSSSSDDVYSADRAVQTWLREGVNSSKIILGMPAFGRSFTLVNPSDHGLLAPASGVGPDDAYLSGGFVAYFTICSNAPIQRNKIRADPGGQMYSWDNGVWMCFDEEQQARDKCAYVKRKTLGGVAFFALDLDDFRGSFCNRDPYPLLRNVSNCLLNEEYITNYSSTAQALEIQPTVTEAATTVPNQNTAAPCDRGITSLPPFVGEQLQTGGFSWNRTLAEVFSVAPLNRAAPWNSVAPNIASSLLILGTLTKIVD